MLAKRIIPCLDVRTGRVVKGTHFLNLRDAGDPVELGAYYSEQGADELTFLDITASAESRKTAVAVAARVAEKVFIPFTVGGGLRTVGDIRDVLKAGADKVSINTGAVQVPTLITQAAELYGSQCVVVAIDAKTRQWHRPEDFVVLKWDALDIMTQRSKWEVYIFGGRRPTGLDAVSWAVEAQRLGAGEILLTSMDRDGTKDGYDLELTAAVAEVVDIPVIASGGAGSAQHIYEALAQGKAEAALVASIVHYGETTIAQIKSYLSERGVQVRPLQSPGAAPSPPAGGPKGRMT